MSDRQVPAPANGRGEIAPAETPRQKFLNAIRAGSSEYMQALPATVPQAQIARAMERVLVSFKAMADRDDQVYACTPRSIFRAVALCALTGLVPGGPRPAVYLLPRNNSFEVDGRKAWRLELDWQLGFHGMLRLVERGSGVRVRPVLVFRGEEFAHTEGLTPNLTHVPDETLPRTWETLRAVYVVASYPDGRKDFAVLYRDGIEKRREKAQSQAVWNQWWQEMSLKTGIRYAYSRGILPDEPLLQVATDHDSRLNVDEAEIAESRRGLALDAEPNDRALPDYRPTAAMETHASPRTAMDAVRRAAEEPEPEVERARPVATDERPPQVWTGEEEAKASAAPKADPKPADPDRDQVNAEIEALESESSESLIAVVRGQLQIQRLRKDAPIEKLKGYAAALREALVADVVQGGGPADADASVSTVEVDPNLPVAWPTRESLEGILGNQPIVSVIEALKVAGVPYTPNGSVVWHATTPSTLESLRAEVVRLGWAS